MNLPLRWKIALTFTVLAAITMAALGYHLRGAVVAQGTEMMRQGLSAQVRQATMALPIPPWEPGPELDALVQQVAAASDARVTLIASDGTVAGDSEHDIAAMENHGSRPERLQALQEGMGSASTSSMRRASPCTRALPSPARHAMPWTPVPSPPSARQS